MRSLQIKYQYASHDPTYLKTGSGSLRFRLVNMRSDYVFVFFRNGREHPVLAARSNVVVMQQHVRVCGRVVSVSLAHFVTVFPERAVEAAPVVDRHCWSAAPHVVQC